MQSQPSACAPKKDEYEATFHAKGLVGTTILLLIFLVGFFALAGAAGLALWTLVDAIFRAGARRDDTCDPCTVPHPLGAPQEYWSAMPTAVPVWHAPNQRFA
nr:hypothetical protein [Pandoravirus belohorizontensis]